MYCFLRRILLISFLLQFPQLAFTQDLYYPDSLTTSCNERLELLKKQFEEDKKSLKQISYKDEREYVENRFQSRFDFYKYSIEAGDFLINSSFEKYIRNLIDIIVTANPELKKDYLVFISRSRVPNAFNTGNGNIVVNIGILDKVENDAQMMYILCHELSHDHFNHVNASIFMKAKKYMNKEFQSKLKKTLKEEYNVKKKLKEFILPELFNDMRFSRSDETQADSMGLIFFRKTGFKAAEALKSMDMLSKIDEFYSDKKIDIKEAINTPTFPFKAEWLTGNHDSSLGTFEKEKKDSLEDSLKTHPDTKIRRELLEKLVGNDSLTAGKQFLSTREDFDKVHLTSEEENIYSTFLDQNLGRSLFLSTILLNEKPDDPFARIMLSWGFSRLAMLMKEHKMQLEVSLPDINYSETYNNYIDFLNQLTFSDASGIGLAMLPPADERFVKSEEYQAANITSYFIKGDKGKAEQLYNDYKQNFSKGKYLEHFKPLFIKTTKK